MPDNFLQTRIEALAFAAAAACVNRQDDVVKGIRAAFKNGVTAQELYEAVLQTYLFAGFPAALEGLSTLERFLKDENISFTSQNRENYEVSIFKKRGEILCREIYTSAYDKMRARVGKLSPELDEWMIVGGYGKTLSRGVLKTVERELIIVGMLAVLGWKNQLFSHLRGAMNVGASEEDCRNVIAVVIPISSPKTSQAAEEVLRTVAETFKKS